MLCYVRKMKYLYFQFYILFIQISQCFQIAQIHQLSTLQISQIQINVLKKLFILKYPFEQKHNYTLIITTDYLSLHHLTFIIQYQMSIKLFFTSLSIIIVINSLSANLLLTQYDPLVFQLTFSEPVQRPNFQLLFNNLYSIPYVFQNQAQLSSIFLIKANIQEYVSTSTLQSYNLLFNNPMAIGNGTLDINSYEIDAQMSNITINFPAAIGIVLVFAGYFFNSFTLLGKIVVQFMQIYILYMFQTNMRTTVYIPIYTGMLLIPPSDILAAQWQDYESFLVICLSVPLVCLFVFALIGFLCKKFAKNERTIFENVVYNELTFNAFLKTAAFFHFNLIYNSIMFVQVSKDPTISIDASIKGVCYTLIYFNIITYCAIIYLKVYILNPKYKETDQSRQKYINGPQFDSFRVLHQKVHLTPWYKRNFQIWRILKMVLIIILFFGSTVFQYFAILLQFMHIFYIFTVRPIVDQFYLNTKVICRLLFFTEFILIVLGNLYYSLGDVTINYQSTSSYIIARDTMFLIFQMTIICIIFVQIYIKCSNLNYQIKLVKEANQYKLQMVQKNKFQSDAKEQKHKTTTIYSDKYSSSSGKRVSSFSEINNKHLNLKNNQSHSSKKNQLQPTDYNRTKNKSKMQQKMIQMTKITYQTEKSIKREKSGSISKGKQIKQQNKQRKWKQESLLEAFAKEK